MGGIFRARVILVSLAMLWAASASYAQTADQLRQLENLTPEQKAAILEAIGESPARTDEQLSTPTTVVPRAVSDGDDSDREDSPRVAPVAIGHPDDADLQPYGYDLFAGEPSTFAPATDIPIPVDYVIGPGDTVEVQLFGAQNGLYTLVVSREGTLNFPELGPISVAGLQFAELRSVIQQRVSEQMLGVSASITMGPLRSIRVFVLGDAHRPGSYTVSALSTMTNALFVSGGVSLIGSLRNIQLKRRGTVVTTMDLYDLLLEGDTSGDARLQPGDVIFIPPAGATVGVSGEVRRPAIYELDGENTVAEVLALAGGLLPSAFPEASRVDRINADRERTIIDVDLSTSIGLSGPVRPDDTIRVFSILEKREEIVVLNGHVYRPGGFQWSAEMRLTDLIPSLDELRPQADPAYVLVRRESPDNLRIDVTSADLGAALVDPASTSNILLRPRDQVFVFEFGNDRSAQLEPILDELRLQASNLEPTRQVAITGRVRAPGAYPLEQGMRISDLLRAGGQLQEAAYALEAELTRYIVDHDQTRRTELITVNLARVLTGDALANIDLLPHDVLNIKEIPLWRDLEKIDVVGEVRFPGSYPIRRGETLRSVIDRAGGMTDLASVDGAVFLREELREREQEQLEDLIGRLESEVEATNAAAQDSAEVVAARRALLEQVRETTATGRLVIDLGGVLSSSSPDADVSLLNGDRLLVPKASQTVTVIGEVQFPTSHVFDGNVSRNDYIDLSGGLTADADKRRIYVVHANGSVEASSSRSFGRSDGAVRPGDTVVVPLDADRISKLGLWTSITTIIYNIGVAAAAVASF